ncbi:hypothetical protein MBLNU459_g5534t1 [Dothideomycetes sp. NU459]
MAASGEDYSVEQEVAAFFFKTSTTRAACDTRAKELVGGSITLVAVQGVCSYTVHAGTSSEFVVQYRLTSLALPLDKLALAHKVYGSLVPDVDLKGQLGEDADGREAVYIYIMPRVNGISHLDFILAYGYPDYTPDICAARLTLVIDVARFFALAWKAPQQIDTAQLDRLRERYEKDLHLLLTTLPDRYRPLIQEALQAMPSIMSLPMILLHKDFNVCNIMVDEKTCHLTGVIDWAEAEVGPFGLNLYSIQQLMEDAFWQTLQEEVDGLSEENIRTIKATMVVRLLLSRGFTSRLANKPEPIPISDDEAGSYNMLHLHGLLIDSSTRFVDWDKAFG